MPAARSQSIAALISGAFPTMRRFVAFLEASRGEAEEATQEAMII